MSKKQNVIRRDFLKEAEEESFEIPSEDDPAFNYFIEWVAEFPEEAAKKYPWFYRKWEAASKSMASWEAASLYKSIVENFPSKFRDAVNSMSSLREHKLKEEQDVLKQSIELGEKTQDTAIKAAYNKYKTILNESLQIVEREIIKRDIEETERINKKRRKLSYLWLDNPQEELPSLYEQMKGRYISPNSTFEQFEAVFSAKPSDSFEPLRWHDDNASEVLYFILMLEQTSNISTSNKTDYQKLKACFVKPNGKPFTANFKVLKQNIDINLSENKQRAIDNLVINFA